MANTKVTVSFELPKGVASEYDKVHRWKPEVYPAIQHRAYDAFMAQHLQDKATYDKAMEERNKSAQSSKK